MKSFALIALLMLGSIAQAQAEVQPTFQQLGFSSETEMQNYLTITDVKVSVVPAATQHELTTILMPADQAAVDLGGSFLDSLGSVISDPYSPSAWIAFGKKAWEVVVANRPVLNVTTDRVTVLPTDKAAWAQMADWKGPRGMTYSVQAINGFGMTMVDQKYTVSYNYGGTLNGKGRYLANATVIPSSISVGWGYTLNSSMEVGQILNIGSTESPVPQVELNLKWGVKTILKEDQKVDSFIVNGNGGTQHFSKSL